MPWGWGVPRVAGIAGEGRSFSPIPKMSPQHLPVFREPGVKYHYWVPSWSLGLTGMSMVCLHLCP